MPLPSNSYETRRDEAAHGTSFLAKLRENENHHGQQLFIWTLANLFVQQLNNFTLRDT